jgi:MoaA/NifB/PqqE/SkfB family radical SAM enzyme
MNEFSSNSAVIMKRRWRKARRRIQSLPQGINIIKYFTNKLVEKYLTTIKSTKVAHPSSIMIEVTNHCNLKCITCPREYDFGEQMAKGFIKLNQLKNIVDEAYPYVDSIGLTGLGETMMYNDLVPAIDYIRTKSNGIIVFISINAHLPKSIEIASKINDKIDTIQISIDGMNEVYDLVRKEGNYSYFIENVTQIVQDAKGKRADVNFNMVVLQQNYVQMTDIVVLAHSIGVKYVNFQTMNLASITGWDKSIYHFYTTDAFKTQLQLAFEKAKELNIEMSTFDFVTKNNFQKCMLPWGHFYISWDGWMTPCCAKPFPKELNFGNVFADGLMTTLNSDGYRYFRSQWYKNETPTFCTNCHIIDIPSLNI